MPDGGDALGGYAFQIEIQGVSIAMFKEVTGLSSETEVIEQKENTAGGKLVIRKTPGYHKWGDITLKRGVTSDKALWQWRKQVEQGDIAGARKNGSVVIYDYKAGEEKLRFNFLRAWPSKMEIDSLQAGSSEMLVETCTITHEGLEQG